VELDTGAWSGDGDFTIALVDALKTLDTVAFVRVEDAPASHGDPAYMFISNEVYVGFAVRERVVPVTRFGILPGRRRVEQKAMSLGELEAHLRAIEAVGPADYEDEGMLQYLRTERVVPPYQTRGYKLIELVRVYEAGTPARR
jgi:hypothetical protein